MTFAGIGEIAARMDSAANDAIIRLTGEGCIEACPYEECLIFSGKDKGHL